ncbi:CDP-alcohol phosphatidyltransferase family protein [Candidatus Hecatella orcuttiae]|uniref:CDP-alcohol phosphatidyltransferase family protein n=1 Tax=Candidatus Hecatella orcuttiae TaxID=1935119 RepID=UPI002867FBB9|nr:CDP-alcohol phosphatidyltransferase family protein [Candidatus Hecatella orcuttiae]
MTKLRIRVEELLCTLAEGLLKAGVGPNTMTALGFILAVSAGYFYAFSPQPRFIWLAASLLLISGLFDALDGAAARLSGRATSFGSFLDSLLDRYSDVAVIFGITLSYREVSVLGVSGMIWGILALTGSLLVSYTRAKGESLGISMGGVGLAERPERILIIFASSIFLRPDLGLAAVAVLSNLTVAHRSLHIYRQSKPK